MRRSKRRPALAAERRRGNTLILILAVTVGIVVALLLFALSYVRLLGTSQEQKTAIEAAALAAARDLSKIVVNTDTLGYIGLSDSAPMGSGCMASDQWPLPVYGINTLIGTARLDLIIGDQLGEADIQNLARQDMTRIRAAWTNELLPVLQASILPGGTAKDIENNNVTPYQSALLAYQQNDIRMTGDTTYVNNSMVLSLGCVTGGAATNIPVPNPQSGAYAAPVASTAQAPGANGPVYLSYVNIPYDGTDFVFGGIGDSVRLMDVKRWVTSIAGLPYQVPTIVKVEAQQLIKDIHSPNGERVKAAACAQPASVYDPKPHPGALTISFPDGSPPGIVSPSSLFTDGQLNDTSNAAEVLKANGGDYPTDTGATLQVSHHPLDSSGTTNNRSVGQCWRFAFYDWLRRAGPKAQIAQVFAMQNTALNPASPATVNWSPFTAVSGTGNAIASVKKTVAQIDGGVIHIFRWEPDGAVSYQSKPCAPYPVSVLSQNQVYCESLDAYNAGSNISVPITAVTAIAKHDYNNGSGGWWSGWFWSWWDDDDDEGPSETLETMTEPVIRKNKWDVYIRDQVRQPGKNLGGKHGGEPLNNAVVAFDNAQLNIASSSLDGHSTVTFAGQGTGAKKKKKKAGAVPMLSAQSDFVESMLTVTPGPQFTSFQPGSGSGVRPTYTTNGSSVDIRFRRQIDVSNFSKTLGFQTGYITEEVSTASY